jgi:UDP-glucose 4-epimerase
MKSLVTGGAGFIGSNLVDKLLSLGHEVVCIDNESSSANKNFYWNESASNYKYDICDYDKIKSLFDGVDYVFHLAAESRIQNTIDNPIKAVKTNSLGTAIILQCAREKEIKRFVMSSTSSVYGRNSTPNKEDQTPDCLNPYSASKLHGEHLCKVYNDLFGLQTIVLRYFNVYGNREPFSGVYAPVLGIFKRQKENLEALTVTGDGLQKRDFTNVFDVVAANILAATKDIDKEFLGTAFNVGSGQNHSVLEIAKTIYNNIVHIPARAGEMKETLADISKSKNILGYDPKTSLMDYVKCFS